MFFLAFAFKKYFLQHTSVFARRLPKSTVKNATRCKKHRKYHAFGLPRRKTRASKNMKTPPMTMLGHYETEKKAAGVVTTTAAAATTKKNKQTDKKKKTNKQQKKNNQQTTNCKDSGYFTSAANSRQISIYSLQFTQTFSRCGILNQQSVGSHSQISTIMECADFPLNQSRSVGHDSQ